MSDSSAQQLLKLTPRELIFHPRESSSHDTSFTANLVLKNLQDTHVGFKFKTNAPNRYSVKPVLGVIKPNQEVDIIVRSDSQVTPQDRFLVQTLKLDESEADTIDAAVWKTLDRKRILEIFIDCTAVADGKAEKEKSESRAADKRAALSAKTPAGKSTTATATRGAKAARDGMNWGAVFFLLLALAVLAVAVLVPYEQLVETVEHFVRLYVPAEYQQYNPLRSAGAPATGHGSGSRTARPDRPRM